MKKTILILLLCSLLTGCPGGKRAPKTRSTFINGNYLCFSINKNDVLNYYVIYSSESLKSPIIKASDNINLNVSYPNTCIEIKWKYGYSYTVSYGLNNKDYHHEFFIDNNGMLTHTGEF